MPRWLILSIDVPEGPIAEGCGVPGPFSIPPDHSVSLNSAFAADLVAKIDQLKADKVYKRLNYLASPQSAWVEMEGRGKVLILSSNNYLGLCNEPSVVQAGIDGLKKYGAGTGSVRFI